MRNYLLTPKLSLPRIVLFALGLLIVAAFLIPTLARADTTPASSDAECSDIIHEHYFDSSQGACLDGRDPANSGGSAGASASASAGTSGKPVLGLIPVPAGFPTDLSAIIASAVTVIFGLAGLVFFAMLLIGGLRYLTAGGDEKAAVSARQTLTNAFIGLIIVVAAFLLSQILFAVFGFASLVNVI